MEINRERTVTTCIASSYETKLQKPENERTINYKHNRKKEKTAGPAIALEEDPAIDAGTSSEGVGTGFDAGTSSEGGDDRLGFGGTDSEGVDGVQEPRVSLDGYASTDDMTTGTRPSDSDISMRSNGISDLSEMGERSALLTVDCISILESQIIVVRLLQRNKNPRYILGVSVPHGLSSFCMR